MKNLILSLIFLVQCISAFSQTEIESNNSFDSANVLALATPMEGFTQVSIDTDFYTIQVSQCGTLVTHLQNNNTGLNYKITVFNSAHASIGTDQNWSINSSPHKEIVVTAGTYFIAVQPLNLGSSTNPYELTVGLDIDDVFECNNTPQTAYPLSINDTIQAKLRGQLMSSTSDDMDYFTVTAPKCGVLVLDIAQNNSPRAHKISIHDQITQIAEKHANAPGGNVHLEKMVEAGIYSILVEHQTLGDIDSAVYTLRINLDTIDEGECNPDFLQAYAVQHCDTVIAAIRPVGDSDFYSFMGTGDTVTLKALNVPSNLNLEIATFDNSYAPILSHSGTLGSPVSLKINTTNNQQYFARVKNQNIASSANPYKFIVQTQSCNPTGVQGLIHSGIKIFPNPNDGEFVLNLPKSPESVKILITDTRGVMIKEFATNQQTNKISLPVSSGVYFLTILSNHHRTTQKIIVNR